LAQQELRLRAGDDARAQDVGVRELLVEHALELCLLRGVVEALAAAGADVLGQRLRVVGVEAVGGDARRVDEALDVLVRGAEDVPRAGEVDLPRLLVAAAKGRGAPGAYNLAGDGTITLSDLARATGRLAFPVPRILLAPAAIGANLPYVPTLAQWVNAGRTPVIMDTTKARRELRWEPRYDTRETLRALTE
jgi:hypothetical protein